MKILHSFLYTVLMFTIITSCNSDNADSDSYVEEDMEFYILNFSIKVSDEEGNNLLSVPDEEPLHYGYRQSDIRVGSSFMFGENEGIISRRGDIIRNIANEVLLNVEVKGKYSEGEDPIKLLEIGWGILPLPEALDYFKYELRKDGDEVKCIKIWHNDELKWKIENSDLPVFSFVKDRNYTNLPIAKPIILTHPKKIISENQFAFNLFKKAITADLNVNKSNTFVSPLSVNFALSMLINGAEGETKDEIKTALEANDFSIEQINEHSKELREALTSVDISTSISIANSIWPEITFPIKDDFIQTNINYYDAVVHPIDFTSPDAIKTVNSWCFDKTKGMIPEALDYLSDRVKLLLINALYFRSTWQKSYVFNKDLTKKETFYSSDGSEDYVDMMRKTGYYLYKSDSDAGYLKIPFGNNAFSMVIILPNEDGSIQTVIDNIDKATSWTTSSNMTSRKVNLSLPKFKMDFSYKMDEYILPEMAMKLPFDSVLADFSGISDIPLYVSEVIHKAAIEVDEDGAAAAAVTIIEEEVAYDGPTEPEVIIDFRVNRPFIFSICESSTGTILFIGKIEKL